MRRGLAGALLAALLAAAAVALRVHNALRYPPDWGFDASFNWQYIVQLTRSWRLPPPATSWATSDPPLFFYASALVMRGLAALGERGAALIAVPLMNTAAGLAVVALAAALVRRAEPENPRRAALAAGLLLYLPAHIQMSVMVNEEMLMTLFASTALFLLARRPLPPPGGAAGIAGAAGVGLCAGLALASKLTGAVAVLTAAASYALDGLRTRSPRPAVLRLAALLSAACLSGGWYFVRNRIEYGYVQPFGLPAHQRMFRLPPGERGPLDYVRVPLATWTDPQLLNPDLLHSVWGSTFATLWFDGHRYFLPNEGEAVRRLGTLTLLLALLPTAAFAVGLAGGARRALHSPGAADTPLLLAVAISLAGYVLYTWRNPWYAVVKGTSLLVLCLPFAFYASEALDRWTRRRGAAALCVWLALAALAACAAAATAFGVLFGRTAVPGLDWEGLAAP